MLPTILKLSIFAAAIFQGVYAAQNQLVQVTGDIGPNPNNVGMFIYKPRTLAKPTPLIVAIHACHGSAQVYFNGTQYANLADQYGFMVLFPSSPHVEDFCFDVHSNGTLTHNGGGDSQGIASMITYSIKHFGLDAKKVYVTGASSGAMMTNVMAGSYPNLFQAGSMYSGVPFACFAGPDSWNTACADGQISMTPQEWGNLVRNAFPGYTGPRPRMMLWHGTVDDVLFYPNFGEELKQWTNVLGDTLTPKTTKENDPQPGYTHTSYGNGNVQAYSAAGVGHNVPPHETVDLAWFGIAGTF